MATTDESTADKRYWHIRLHKNLVLTLGILLLFAAGAKVFLVVDRDYRRRALATEAIVVAHEVAREVEQAISQPLESDPHASIPASIISQFEKYPDVYKTVAHDGTIVTFSQRTGTLIVYRPQVGADGKVNWTCLGASAYGNEILPARCRVPQPEP
ncbi:hypothetical protein AGMMS50289_07180 [Betaproteobacteria bacterium]|nr:hypothetical protein AGMMS50289_07180 [Betaproteobacteria bacterium]